MFRDTWQAVRFDEEIHIRYEFWYGNRKGLVGQTVSVLQYNSWTYPQDFFRYLVAGMLESKERLIRDDP